MPFYLDNFNSKCTILFKALFNQIKKISLLKMAGNLFHSPVESRLTSNKRAAFRIFRRGSLTVEAAAALPLFFLGVLACICMMDLYSLRIDKVTELQQRAERLGMYAHGAGEDLEVSVIDLVEYAEWQVPFLPFQLPRVRVACRGRVHAWVGRQREKAEAVPEEAPVLVYVTAHESVYHTTSRCTHLSLRIRQLPAHAVQAARNSQGSRYRACEKCVGGGAENALLYVTEQGDCYHNSLECSGLKRSIRMVELEEVRGLSCCSRCSALDAEAAA